MQLAAKNLNIKIPASCTVEVEVALGKDDVTSKLGLEVEMNITLPGVEKADAEEVVYEAHKICPYCNATRNNLNVKLHIEAPDITREAEGA